MKFQWSIQSSYTQLVLSQVVYLNYRNEHIWPPTKLDYIILKLFIWLLTFHNISSFWNNTSYFEIDAWNFWYFNLMNKPLAFGHQTIQYMSLSLFPSQILVCATAFSAHYLFSRFDICWALKQKHKWVKRDIGTSLYMYQD